MVSDSVDGILSRSYYGHDPELRGTLDVTLDEIGLSVIIILLGLRFYYSGLDAILLALIAFSLFAFLYEFFIATKFRIFGKIRLDPASSILDREPVSGEQIRSDGLKRYLEVKRFFEARGVMFYPTIVDAEFLAL